MIDWTIIKSISKFSNHMLFIIFVTLHNVLELAEILVSAPDSE